MTWTKPDINSLYDVIDDTWAPFSKQDVNGWCIREGRGGGKRVSAANQIQVGAEIEDAEKAMKALKQPKLFMIRDGYPTLEMQLAKREYTIIDPVIILAKQTDQKSEDIAADFLDEPTNEQLKIWKKGGIDRHRIEVMNRVENPKTFLQVEGATAFASISNEIAMVHAVEVAIDNRRKGLGQKIMQAASVWASMKGAETISVIATRQNRPAQALYKNLGYKSAGAYHYRIKR